MTQTGKTSIAFIGIGVVLVLVAFVGAPVQGKEWIPPMIFIVGAALAGWGFVLRRRRPS